MLYKGTSELEMGTEVTVLNIRYFPYLAKSQSFYLPAKNRLRFTERTKKIKGKET
jgi:hypothetical protein